MDGQEKQLSLESAVCPVPVSRRDRVLLGHGSGGRMMHDLIREVFLPPMGNSILVAGDDAGVVAPDPGLHLAISTDAHVVAPLFFPGGDIGRLAVCGTVNDVAMMGAKPLYLTTSFILEEGLEIALLERILISMRNAAEEAGVKVVAGDTKVVEKGKADGVYIITSGVGALSPSTRINGSQACPGDLVILSGPIGDHGIAVLSARGDLGFEADVESDIAPLNHMIDAMLDTSERIHVLRDPTRGGVATSLNEIARQSGVAILVDETSIPVRPGVRAACELLGFDPLYIANEGKLIAVVASEDGQALLKTMRAHPSGEAATIIGKVQPDPAGRVLMRTAFGSTRILDTLSGELLPRIC